MKLLLTSLTLALVSSTASSAAPDAAAPVTSAPAPVEALQPALVTTPSTPALSLARQFAGMTISADLYLDLMRTSARQAATDKIGEVEEATLKQGVDRVFILIEPTIREQLPNLREAYAQAYAREFSAAELQQMIAFAATPAGRHFISRSDLLDLDPEVVTAQEVMGVAMMPVVQRARKTLCAEKAAARMAAGDTKAKCPLSAPTPRSG